jgi:THO complex subunit 2
MSRGERPGDIMRDRPRDPLERRGLDNIPRDINRPSDRGMGPDRERDRHDPIRRSGEPRDPRENRDLRDRPFIDSMRLADANGRPVRGDAIGPHRSVALQSDRTPSTLNAERLLAANTERHTHVSTNNEPPRPDPPRGGRDEHRDRPSSRPHSPRRLDSYIAERDHAHGRRNDRPNMGRPSTSDMQDFPRNRHDEQWAAPAGPRDDRPGDRGPSERGRDGSAFQPPLPPPRSLDTNHGRLNQSSRSQQDPNFGRLNSGPPPPIPSGPRDRNIRGGPGGLNRMSSLSQPRFDGRPAQESPRPPTPDRQPPTGPASNRPPRHGAPAQFDAPAPLPIPASVPASPNTIIHPDRLKQLDPTVESQGNVQSTSQQAPPLPSPIVPPLVSVHPDRFKAIHGDQGHSRPPPPLSLQTANIRTSTMNAPSPISSGPPLGPKGHHSSNNTPSTPNGMSAPTGPASNIDRTRGPRRQLAGIQNTLQQAGQQGSERFGDRVTNIRGRSTRNNGINSPGVEPPSPSGPPTPTLPPRPEAREGFMPVDRNRDLINPDRPDLFSNRGHNGSDNDRERERADNHARGRELPPSSGRRERSDRHSSRRDSREHSPAREHREDREQRGGRESRTLEDSSRSGEEYRGRRTSERDRRQGGNGEMSGRGTEREMGRRDGGEKNRAVPNLEPEWGGGQPNIIRGSGGRRDLRPSGSDIGRRDSRGGGRDDASSSSRKRRTDEVGIVGDMRGHDKRLRR